MGDEFFGTPREAEEASRRSSGEFRDNLFWNETGLRAGWRLLIYAAFFFAFMIVSIFLLSALMHPARGVFSSRFQFFGELASFLSAFLAAWIMSRIERRQIGVYGLPLGDAFGRQFWVGCAFGLCEILVLIGLIAAFGG